MAAAEDPPTLAEVPMLSACGLPCIELTVGNYPNLKMLLDSKRHTSVLDVTTAVDLGLDLKPMVGADGKACAGCYSAVIGDVRIGEISIGDLQVKVVDLRTSVKQGKFPDADGALAFSVWSDRIISLDYTRHVFGISKLLRKDPQPPVDHGILSRPTFGRDGQPVLATTGFELNGRPITAQIDTLYAGTVIIYPNSVERLGLSSQQLRTKKVAFPFTDDGMEMIEGSAQSEGFNGQTLKSDAPLYLAAPGVPLSDGQFDATVGDALFRGRVLTFDLCGQLFWMK